MPIISASLLDVTEGCHKDVFEENLNILADLIQQRTSQEAEMIDRYYISTFHLVFPL